MIERSPVTRLRRLALLAGATALGVAAAACADPTASCQGQEASALDVTFATDSFRVGEQRLPTVRAVLRCGGTQVLDSGQFRVQTAPGQVAVPLGDTRVLALDTGVATVTITHGTIDTSFAVAVLPPLPVGLIEISPRTASVPSGSPGQTFSARVLDVRGRELPPAWSRVTWSADDPAVQFAAAGRAYSLVAGTYQVRAALQGVTATATLTVTPQPVSWIFVGRREAVTGPILVGDTVGLYADGYITGPGSTLVFVRRGADEWTVADTTIGRVLPDSGGARVVALKPGLTTVRARMGETWGGFFFEVKATP